MKQLFAGLLALAFVGVLSFAGCTKPVDPNIKQGFAVVRHLAAPRQLQNSAFAVMFPECKPSQFVTFLFSIHGTAIWPPTKEMADMEGIGLDGLRAAGIPYFPDGVTLQPNVPNQQEGGTQIVLVGDDAKGVVVMKAYQLPAPEVVATEEVTIPTVTPSAGAEIMYKETRELGGY